MAKIKFLENTHQYLTEDGKELISVSKFTDQFKEKIDWATIAGRVATKETKAGNPTTKQQILDKWEHKRVTSANIGTIYHSIREKEILSEDSPIFYNVPCEKKQCIFEGNDKYSIPINELQNNTIYTELMIYDLDYMICGQSDKVIVTNNTINVWDYKTDAEIKFQAYSSQWVDPRKMLPPLTHLDDANGIHYSIKMSLYMYMLWKANKGRFRPGELVIEHISLKRDKETGIPILSENQTPIVEKIDIIKLPYRKKEVMDMLKTINI